ncbi:MAG: helix-turn-helix domain-containing protein [Candidatus Aenigmatarchaeota archaeon]
MREKNILLSRTIKVLEENGYNVLFYGRCFDMIAKRENKWLIKVLYNLDSFDENKAKNMRIFSYFMSCYPFLISEISNNGKLEDDLVYFRYNICCGNLNTFTQIIKNMEFKSFTVKGKHLVKIDIEKMKKIREEKNISLAQVSSFLKISKKSLYEIENGLSLPTRETAAKLENFFGTNLILGNQVKVPSREIIKPRSYIDRKVSYLLERIGIENSSLNININLVGKSRERMFIVSKRINKKEEYKIYQLSQFLQTFTFYIGKEKTYILSRIPLTKIEKINSIDELKELIGY